MDADAVQVPTARMQSLHAEAAPKLSVHDYAAVPVYISLMKWTSRGLGGLPAWRDRLEEGEREIEKRGGRLLDVFVTLGRYDVVEIFEAPDDETATQILVGDHEGWQRDDGDAPGLHAGRGREHHPRAVGAGPRPARSAILIL